MSRMRQTVRASSPASSSKKARARFHTRASTLRRRQIASRAARSDSLRRIDTASFIKAACSIRDQNALRSIDSGSGNTRPIQSNEYIFRTSASIALPALPISRAAAPGSLRVFRTPRAAGHRTAGAAGQARPLSPPPASCCRSSTIRLQTAGSSRISRTSRSGQINAMLENHHRRMPACPCPSTGICSRRNARSQERVPAHQRIQANASAQEGPDCASQDTARLTRSRTQHNLPSRSAAQASFKTERDIPTQFDALF